MVDNIKNIKIKSKDDKMVLLNGEQIPFDKWIDNYIKPLLIRFGAEEVIEEKE